VWIGKDVTGRFLDKFDVLCGLEEMIEDMWIGKDEAGNTQVQYEVICGFEQMLEDDVLT
jgi:hypothetical protein